MSTDQASTATPQPTARFLAASLDIGHGLQRQADTDPAGWPVWRGDELVGPGPEPGSEPAPSRVRIQRIATGPGLYGGSAGIGWFLAHLGAWTQDPSLQSLGVQALEGAVQSALQALQGRQSQSQSQSQSLYSGAAGVAWVAWQTAERVANERLKQNARGLGEALAQLVCRQTSAPDELDLISGAAGVAVALAALHRSARLPEAGRACECLAQTLVRAAHTDALFASWPDPHGEANARPLCGLAHGASGMAWALFEAAAVTGNDHFAEVAQRALAYERSWFAPETCTWPDLRQGQGPSDGSVAPTMTAWCHGGIGIAALRLHLHERSTRHTPLYLAEASAGLHGARTLVTRAQRALAAGQSFDATLCHGVGGIAELYTLAHEITGMPEHARAARRTGTLCLDLLRHTGGRWTCGLQGASQVPGLMVGDAGIGTMLLRLHDPRAIDTPLLPGRQHVPRIVSDST